MDAFWDYHTKGDAQCDACLMVPTSCDACEGLLHTHFDDVLDVVQAKCDQCDREAATPEPPEILE